MIRPAQRAILVAALCIMASGCAGPPAPRRPVAGTELAEIAGRFGARLSDGDALRGSGRGTFTASGRRLHFRFAMLYSHPGWVRADVRPEVGFAGASLTGQALAERGCLELYIPGRALRVAGCLSDDATSTLLLEPSILLLGLVPAATLANMDEVLIREGASSLEIEGDLDGVHLSMTFDTASGALTKLEAARGGAGPSIHAEYSAHTRTGELALPARVELRSIGGGGEDDRADFTYATLRGTNEVDRADYRLDVPADVTTVGWNDLNIWGNKE